MSSFRDLLNLVPGIVQVIIKHYLFPSQSQHTQSWDLRTLLLITFLRLHMLQTCTNSKRDKPESQLTIEEFQQLSIPKSPEVTDNTWYIPYQFKIPWKHQGGIDIRDPNGPAEIKALEQLLDQCIKELALDVGDDGLAIKGIPPAKVSEEGESGVWAGYRDFEKRGKYTKETRETAPEQRWECLMSDIDSLKEELGAKHRGVIMFLHGGAFALLDPNAYISTAASLSKAAGMPVLLPRYRLSPQAPFPLALLDVIIAYLYLLYPPVGSLHAPYSPSEIFIAGDSAGGNLAVALAQFLIWLNPSDKPPHTITWCGASRILPKPSGIILYSAFIDITRCLGSKTPSGRGGNSEYTCCNIDFIPNPDVAFHPDSWRPSSAWPPNPKRRTLYTSDESTIHPLVSPIIMQCAADSSSGTASPSLFPPTYLSIGEECLRDANFYFASILLKTKTPLKMEYFRFMPHDFQFTAPSLNATVRSLKTIREFVLANTTKERGKEDGEGEFKYDQVVLSCPNAETIGTLSEEELSLNGLAREELLDMMKKEIKKWDEEFKKGEENPALKRDNA